MLQVCFSRCCICFTHTLHVFYLDVAYGCNGFQAFFQMFFSSVSTAFTRMLQLLYLDVSKVDRVLHLSSAPSAASSRRVLLPAPTRHPYDVAAGSFRIGGAVPFPLLSLGRHGPRVEGAKQSASRRRPSGHPGASTTDILNSVVSVLMKHLMDV